MNQFLTVFNQLEKIAYQLKPEKEPIPEGLIINAQSNEKDARIVIENFQLLRECIDALVDLARFFEIKSLDQTISNYLVTGQKVYLSTIKPSLDKSLQAFKESKFISEKKNLEEIETFEKSKLTLETYLGKASERVSLTTEPVSVLILQPLPPLPEGVPDMC